MGLPSKRRTSRSKKERAAHFALSPISVARCADCTSAMLPHHACPSCGKYRGRTVVHQEKRVARTMRKEKRKQ